MKYLLDTSTLSDVGKNHAAVAARVFSLAPDLIAVSTITIMEVEYGLSLNPTKAMKVRETLTPLLNSVHVLPFSEADARNAGTVRALLRKTGKTIGAYDVLLAGVALARDLIFVTSNTREFEQVPDLKLENWRSDHH